MFFRSVSMLAAISICRRTRSGFELDGKASTPAPQATPAGFQAAASSHTEPQ
jgi:hypothetical protein